MLLFAFHFVASRAKGVEVKMATHILKVHYAKNDYLTRTHLRAPDTPAVPQVTMKKWETI